MLSALRPAFGLVVVSTPGRGRAAARNRALVRARGEVVILLDDDMHAEPSFVEAHRRHHTEGTNACVLGPVPVELHAGSPRVADHIRENFDALHTRLLRSDHQYSPRDFYSGNASLRREVLEAAGGFDETFARYGNEDVELALRLMESGVVFAYEPGAVARQEYDKHLPDLAGDTRSKGRTTVLLARTHPHVFATLRLASVAEHSRSWLTLRAVLLAVTRLWASAPPLIVAVAATLERARLWHGSLAHRTLLDYCFWVGVDEELRVDDGPPLDGLRAELRLGPVGVIRRRRGRVTASRP